jgi:hypothetical protein
MQTQFRRSSLPGQSLRGQSLVELAIVLPFLMFLILGAVEFGSAFNHHLTLEYASREGARVGSALVNGGGSLGCGAGKSPNAAEVDPHIISAVQGVLGSSGSPVALDEVSEIRIYKANSSGGEVAGLVNVWTYTPGAGPVVDGAALDFSPPATVPWPACARNNLQPADSIGVRLTYSYQTQTPFSALMGWASMPMSDRTIMAMNPTNQ